MYSTVYRKLKYSQLPLYRLPCQLGPLKQHCPTLPTVDISGPFVTERGGGGGGGNREKQGVRFTRYSPKALASC